MPWLNRNNLSSSCVHITPPRCVYEHIAFLCKKAGRQLNALSRLSSTLDVSSKMILFKSFILCHFNYCPVVWHCCGMGDAKKIEKIQCRALRYIYRDFLASYSDLRLQADQPLMYIQRLRLFMIEMYKICHEISPKYLYELVSVKNTDYAMRNAAPLLQPKYQTTKYGLNSFKYQGAKIWNALDGNIKDANNLKLFKRLIKTWDGAACKCSGCKYCVLHAM